MAQSVKGQNPKLKLEQEDDVIYQEGDESRESIVSKKLKLASARNTRPPKGISNLCSTSNKFTDSNTQQTNEPNEPINKMSSIEGADIESKKNQ